MTTPAVETTKTRTSRYGEIESGQWRVYFMNGVTADMAVPSSGTDGVASKVGAEIAWCVIFPAGPTSITLSTYRRVGVIANGEEVVAGTWVRDDEVTLTESGTIFQYNLSDRLAPRIHDIVGVPAASFVVLYKRVSRRA